MVVIKERQSVFNNHADRTDLSVTKDPSKINNWLAYFTP